MNEFEDRPLAPVVDGDGVELLDVDEAGISRWERVRRVHINQQRIQEFADSIEEQEHSQDGALARGLRRDRYLPRLRLSRFLPKRVREKAHLPEEVDEQVQIIRGFLASAGLIIFSCLAIGLFIALLFSVNVREPQNAKEVMQRVENVTDAAYSTEIVRIRNIDGANVRRDLVFGWQVNIEKKAFQLQLEGIEGGARVAGDGKTALVRRGNEQTERFKVYPPRSLWGPITQEDLTKSLGPGELVDNKFTANSERAWLLTWQPSSEILARILQEELLQSIIPEDPLLKDIAKIKAGKFKVQYATLTILRKSHRVFQFDISFSVDKAQYRVLTTVRKANKGILRNYKIDTEVAPQID